MRRRALLLCLAMCLALFASVAEAALKFPALSGQVVDEAGMIDNQSREHIAQMLRAHEELTTEQVVVVTVPNLQGSTIEDFGYQLGRFWASASKARTTACC